LPGDREIGWDPAPGEIDSPALEGIDAVCHLSGEPLVGRWTTRKKRAILESRRNSTRLLADALSRLERRPETLVRASGANYYGDRGDEVPSEEATGFRFRYPEIEGAIRYALR
jgi:NAD dependent epimerase/dehydratase family enzyme